MVLVLGAVLCLPGMAGAFTTVLTFDDLATQNGGGSWGVLPTNYGGFTWSASGTTRAQWDVIANSGYRGGFGNNFDFPSNPNALRAGPLFSDSRIR